MVDEKTSEPEPAKRKLSLKDQYAAQVADEDAEELGEGARRELLDPER